MGLPMSLDGLPDKLQLKNSIECPMCKQQVTSFKKKKTSEGRITAVCELCGDMIPESFNVIIKAHIK